MSQIENSAHGISSEQTQPIGAPSTPAALISHHGGQGPNAGCPYDLPAAGVQLDDVVKGLIEQALARVNGNQSAAARLLGITRYTLRYRMEKYGLR